VNVFEKIRSLFS